VALLLILIRSSEVDGKLSENSFAWEQKTVRKFRCYRNIPPSSSELVELIWSSCQKSFPSPLQVSLLHRVRLAEFSVNFFFSAARLCFFSKKCMAGLNSYFLFCETTSIGLGLPIPPPTPDLIMNSISKISISSKISFYIRQKKKKKQFFWVSIVLGDWIPQGHFHKWECRTKSFPWRRQRCNKYSFRRQRKTKIILNNGAEQTWLSRALTVWEAGNWDFSHGILTSPLWFRHEVHVQ